MQKAVDIVNTSPHPTNKIAATLCGLDASGRFFSASRTNYWPPAVLRAFGPDARIGSSSGTIHAETECILTAPFTEGASLFITDPFCPNCAKNMAEAGLKTIYIDHKGFDKDFAARRGHHFGSLSMQICEKAGMSVYEIRRKEQKIIPILEIDPAYKPANDSPVRVEPAAAKDTDSFIAMIQKRADTVFRGRRIAAALALDGNGNPFFMTARRHPVVGYSLSRDAGELLQTDGKYSFFLEPVNRLLMNAPRCGLKIVDGLIYSSGVPTSREQVNLIGAGLSRMMIGDRHKARDEDAQDALRMLEDKGILSVRDVPMDETL